jgi:hypothetical protein
MYINFDGQLKTNSFTLERIRKKKNKLMMAVIESLTTGVSFSLLFDHLIWEMINSCRLFPIVCTCDAVDDDYSKRAMAQSQRDDDEQQ